MVVPDNSVPLPLQTYCRGGREQPTREGVRGTGKRARLRCAHRRQSLWEFSSVAQPGSGGHDTWEGDSWTPALRANAWPFYFTLDEQRGLLYLPLASPIPGGYGGDRTGANLYETRSSPSMFQTGTYRWHFQTIHHDFWDADRRRRRGFSTSCETGVGFQRWR